MFRPIMPIEVLGDQALPLLADEFVGQTSSLKRKLMAPVDHGTDGGADGIVLEQATSGSVRKGIYTRKNPVCLDLAVKFQTSNFPLCVLTHLAAC